MSRSEAQALDVIASGTTRLGEVYVASHYQREDPIFLADSVFALYMEGLSRAAEPLIERTDGGIVAAPRGSDDRAGFRAADVTLTPFGRDVLERRQDRVAMNGLDRWLGGVHLCGHVVRWRWDEAERRLHDVA